jgi:hypothetical protein
MNGLILANMTNVSHHATIVFKTKAREYRAILIPGQGLSGSTDIRELSMFRHVTATQHNMYMQDVN